MGRLGRDAKILLYGITAVCVLAFLMAIGVACQLTGEVRDVMVSHDCGVAGYLLDNEDGFWLSAFTAEKSEEEVARGGEALASVGYGSTVAVKLLPAVLSYGNRVGVRLVFLMSAVFGAIYFLVFFYLRKEHKAIQKAEGSIREFLEGNAASRIESGQSGAWYSLFHEVNELSSVLSAHAEKEKQTKEFLRDMISDISHQVKTPLSALKMYQEILESHRDDAEAVENFSEKSLREIKRIEDVIYTLLKLARLDAGTIPMRKSPERVSLLAQDVLERFEVQAGRENKTITLRGEEDICLYCDALWISEAMGNIVKNALDHTGQGGNITVRWEQNPFMTKIIVEDNGKGIHPEDIYHIFKRFYRSRFSQDIHGIGLGLPLARAIVELHGGTITVTSKLGNGTVFTLNFYTQCLPETGA